MCQAPSKCWEYSCEQNKENLHGANILVSGSSLGKVHELSLKALFLSVEKYCFASWEALS